MLGGQAEPGPSEVLEFGAARHAMPRSVRSVPVEDERPRRAPGLEGRDYGRPRIMRGPEMAESLVRRDQPQRGSDGAIDADPEPVPGEARVPADFEAGVGA